MSRIVLSLWVGLLGVPGMAQLVAFTGKDSNPAPTDEFAFVALQDLAPGTTIFFTENDFDNTTGEFNSTEGTILFTVAGGTIATGTVVQIAEDGVTANTFNVTNGGSSTAAQVGGSAWSPTSGDPHYAYSASNASSPWNTVTQVHAMLFPLINSSTFGTRDPSTVYPNAIVVDNASWAATQVAVDFTGDRSSATHTSLADSSNFTGGDGDLDLSMFSSVPVELASFTID